MFGFKRKVLSAVVELDDNTLVEEPPKLEKPSAVPIKSRIDALREYERLSTQVGVDVPELRIERMKNVLEELDYPCYNLTEVVKYMDAKAAEEMAQDFNEDTCGWRWFALRDKDRFDDVRVWFGRPAAYVGGKQGWRPASDYYGANRYQQATSLYRHTIPLHALKRISAIERQYKDPLHFLVSDYATKDDSLPDPFLMVVVPNPLVERGEGRFVIDFWDEPGFGVEQMLK